MRKARELRTRPAGRGKGGDEYGVTSFVTDNQGKGGFRRKTCKTCPWRLDAEVGRFPAEAYVHSAPTAYDAALSLFACHEAGADNAQTCAGFLRANAANNIGARIAAMRGDYDPRRMGPDAPLYASYRAMAEANGVPSDHPALDDCRGDGEEDPRFARRGSRRQAT